MHPVDLEQAVDRELKGLPVRRAPDTLLPRVMAAVRAWANRPWYARAWFTWPAGLQVASVAVAAALIAGAVAIAPFAQGAALNALARPAALTAAPAARTLQGTVAAIDTGRVIWRAVVEPLAPYGAALVAAMCVACLAFGVAINRLVMADPFSGQRAPL